MPGWAAQPRFSCGIADARIFGVFTEDESEEIGVGFEIVPLAAPHCSV
jgi:hypothetical protein